MVLRNIPPARGVWERVEAADVENIDYEAPAESLPVDAVAVLVLDKR